jgi:hypothetical protein
MTKEVEADITAFGAAVTDLLTKVTISASNYNASKEVLEKFEHSPENKPKKRYSRNFLLPSEGRYWSPSLGLGFSSILGGCRLLHMWLFKIWSLINFITMKRLLLILNIFALLFGALATQSCEDTSGGYQHGYYNRNYYNGDAYNSGDYNERPYDERRYTRGYIPSDRPSIDVHLWTDACRRVKARIEVKRSRRASGEVVANFFD